MQMTGLVHVTHFHIVVVPLVGRNFGVLMDLVGINFSDNVANMVCPEMALKILMTLKFVI